MEQEVAIIGGASAGLSAALTLGRARRRTIVFDAGEPRNKPAAHAQNIFTRDGTPPLELLRIAREQLKPYTSVQFSQSRVTGITQQSNRFIITNNKGETFSARRVILATGLTDLLPEIKGLKALWGGKVIHCPYCHGWEVRDEPVALINNGKAAEHVVPLVYNLNKQVQLFTNGTAELSPKFKEWLAGNNIPVIESTVTELIDYPAGVVVKTADGKQSQVTAVYVRATGYKFHNELAVQLGCSLTEEGAVVVDEHFQTTVPGVFAVGDLSHPMAHQVIFAASSGTKAGIACNGGLIMQDYEQYQKA
ncbi:NAD(P)/FAD-dependent oxidoreductase [Pseudoflavitalea sp. G-6-1-2]|uniref:NAD(P)/FAD-dependent oxidoreductase n=1 Tax=Pseudoflavitalea sp. G-6-1-2 TaxID=2728841 RepID=UPI00146B7F9C|nr:NAD(P)/FAD-dependent oxidoreductase [Pseudoflavitalea sp. G-6-1-2]NML23583.1 NAD(P)/FAD-dependent oxidoreductase [Pseudoflavitalea sp. G-6-1-2]